MRIQKINIGEHEVMLEFGQSCQRAYRAGRRCSFLLPLTANRRGLLLTVLEGRAGAHAAANVLRSLRAEDALHACRLGDRRGVSCLVTEWPALQQLLIDEEGVPRRLRRFHDPEALMAMIDAIKSEGL